VDKFFAFADVVICVAVLAAFIYTADAALDCSTYAF